MVGCGTVTVGPPIGSGRGPMRIVEANYYKVKIVRGHANETMLV